MTTQGISLSALARRLGRAKSGLHRLAKTGQIPRGDDGLFDLEAVRKALASNVDPGRSKGVHKPVHVNRRHVNGERSSAPPIVTPDDAKDAVALIARVLAEEGVPAEAGAAVDFTMARTADTILKARQRAFALEVQRKRYVELDKVKAHIGGAFNGYRQAVERLPSRFAAQLAAEVGCDARALDAALTAAIRTVLEELSAPVVRG